MARTVHFAGQSLNMVRIHRTVAELQPDEERELVGKAFVLRHVRVEPDDGKWHVSYLLVPASQYLVLEDERPWWLAVWHWLCGRQVIEFTAE